MTTSRQWRRLVQEVAVVRRGDPSPGAQKVLLLILDAAAAERPWVSQAALASSLGQSPEWVSARYAELQGCGLVAFVPQGNQPARPLPNVAVLRAWLSGEPLVYPEIAGAVIPEKPGTNGGVNPEKPGAPRARGHGGGGGAVAAAVGAAPGEQAPEWRLEEELPRAVAVLRANGVRMPYTMQVRLRGWLERGIQVEDVEHAGEQAAANAAGGFGYVERIFERLFREAAEQVIPIEEWRAR